jgi:signal transduction histidine kinase
MHGQVVNGYKNGFVVPIGYEELRSIIFFVILILAIVVSVLRRNPWPLSVIPATVISLPILEIGLGSTYPWIFVAALFFFLGRSIKIFASSVTAIRSNISALSVIHAINTLQAGVLFSESDGTILLSNHQMQNLMIAITGKVFRNAEKFYDVLASDRYESRYKKAELEGQMVYLLPDETAWMFTKTDIPFRMKKYVHISVADVSELWALTTKLQSQNQELRHKSDELKETIANLHVLSKEWEIENARMRAHDILGQRLTVLLHTIQNDHNLDYELLTSLSKGLLDELKAEQGETGPYDELESIQRIFSAIGVDIQFEGQLPADDQQAALFVDIIRESSTNAVRHGFANKINIQAEPKENEYKLIITNNGHTTSAPLASGSGIETMRKKVGAQGGNLDIYHYPLFILSVVLPGGEPYE